MAEAPRPRSGSLHGKGKGKGKKGKPVVLPGWIRTWAMVASLLVAADCVYVFHIAYHSMIPPTILRLWSWYGSSDNQYSASGAGLVDSMAGSSLSPSSTLRKCFSSSHSCTISPETAQTACSQSCFLPYAPSGRLCSTCPSSPTRPILSTWFLVSGVLATRPSARLTPRKSTRRFLKTLVQCSSLNFSLISGGLFCRRS